jgi:hypothetical protein
MSTAQSWWMSRTAGKLIVSASRSVAEEERPARELREIVLKPAPKESHK